MWKTIPVFKQSSIRLGFVATALSKLGDCVWNLNYTSSNLDTWFRRLRVDLTCTGARERPWFNKWFLPTYLTTFYISPLLHTIIRYNLCTTNSDRPQFIFRGKPVKRSSECFSSILTFSALVDWFRDFQRAIHSQQSINSLTPAHIAVPSSHNSALSPFFRISSRSDW